VSGRANRSVFSGPYETREQARAAVAHIYEQARRSIRRGVLAEANHAHLVDACQSAGVTLGAYDARILAWLANYEPETCAVITGLITRASAVSSPTPRTGRAGVRRNASDRSTGKRTDGD
jgi:hypothetical protein